MSFRFKPLFIVALAAAAPRLAVAQVSAAQTAEVDSLLNEDSYDEIRDEGIVPAYKRNYYGGVSFKF